MQVHNNYEIRYKGFLVQSLLCCQYFEIRYKVVGHYIGVQYAKVYEFKSCIEEIQSPGSRQKAHAIFILIENNSYNEVPQGTCSRVESPQNMMALFSFLKWKP